MGSRSTPPNQAAIHNIWQYPKMSLTLPILVIGIEPRDYAPIKKCYNRALVTLQANVPGATLIPFNDRMREQPSDESTEEEE